MKYFTQTSVSLGDDWKATEYTLAANQLLSDWKSKQLSWNEESKSQGLDLLNKAKRLIQDISENIDVRGKSPSLTAEGATTIQLREFQIRTFKITKA